MTDEDSNWRLWPALLGIGSTQRWRLACHQAGQDDESLAWVAELDLERGSGDRPELCWLARDERHLAAQVMRRRSAGQPLVLEWQNQRGLPAALGALCILPHLASSARDQGEDQTTIHLEALALAESIRSGCRQLQERLGPDGLTEIYAGVLAGRLGIALPTEDRPWPPEALAALLLPLDRPVADRLSIGSATLARDRDPTGWTDWVVAGAPGNGTTPSVGGDQLARAARLARAVMEDDPESLSAPAPGISADTARAREVRLWGAASSGKTAYLAQLFASLDHGGDPRWTVRLPPGANRASLEDQLRSIRRDNRFPVATAAGRRDELVYRLVDSETGRGLTLAMEDRPGADYELLDPAVAQRLATADALVLLLDPNRDRARQEEEVRRAFLAIQQGRTDPDRDPRPLAVCISKCDEYVRDLVDLDRMLADPDALLERLIGKAIADALRRDWQRYRVFPLSAAGLRLFHGAVEPSAFYDESLSLRINPQATPIHLLDPLLWVMETIGE